MGLVQTQHQLKFAFMAIIDGIRTMQQETDSLQSYVADEELDSVQTESDSDSDDDFYENNDTKKELVRPGTAVREKRLNLSKKSKTHIENLRKKQKDNKLIIKLNEPNNNLIKETSSDTNIDSSDLEKSDEEDIPFAVNRLDVQTVRVNQQRKPVEPLLIPKSDESDEENVKSEIKSETNSLMDQSNAYSPRTSEKNQRISDLVKSMREKQKKHESRSKLLSDLRPYIYGGAILLSGIVIHQLYKTFVSK